MVVARWYMLFNSRTKEAEAEAGRSMLVSGQARATPDIYSLTGV